MRDYKNTAHTKIYKAELRQFQYMTVNEVIHHQNMNNKIQERTISYVYLSILSKFWLITGGLHIIDGANKNLCVRYFSSPA